MGSFLQDVRYAARLLAKSSGFTSVVVVILGLGIGANTAVFSIVNSVLIRPLGFADADRLVAIHEGIPGASFNRAPFSPPDLLDLERYQQSFEAVGAYRNVAFELSGGADAEQVRGAKITASLFPLLGAEPALGRLFAQEEDRPGQDLVLVSWRLWQRRYAGSPDLIGRAIQLDRRPYTVIGVMPASWQFPRRGPQLNNEPADVWVPMAFTEQERTARGNFFNQSVIAKLKRGTTLAQAQSDLNRIVQRIRDGYPAQFRNNTFVTQLQLPARPLHEEISGRVGTPLLMLLAAIGLVLLVACGNVANLMLSRAAARERELTLRAALGATSRQLLQMQLAEASLLAAMGGVLGIVIARGALDAVPAVVAERVPGLEGVPVDVRVLLFTAALSILTAVLFSVIPFLATHRRDLNDVLREATTGATPGTRRQRVQNGLVVVTIAMAFVVLMGAGLFLRSFSALISTDPGFRPGGVLTMSVALPREAYGTAASVRAFHRSLQERATALPGVRSAAVATDLPLESYEIRTFTPERPGAEPSNISQSARLTWVNGPYFQTLGFTLRRGRLFTEDEYADNRRVVIVNEKLATRYWPNEDPIGKRLKWGAPQSPTPWLTIVGVVGEAADGPEAVALMADDRPIHAYEPFRQFPDLFLDRAVTGFGRDVKLAVLGEGDPTRLTASLRRELASLDPQLAVARIALMDERLDEMVAPRRFSTVLLTSFATGALLLVAIGLYGLLAFTVALRTREIGVRIALGAEPRTVVGIVLRQGLTLAAIGLVLGLGASLGVTRFVSSLLYQTDPYDLVTFASVPLVVIVVTLLACGLPARRAAATRPIDALRYE